MLRYNPSVNAEVADKAEKKGSQKDYQDYYYFTKKDLKNGETRWRSWHPEQAKALSLWNKQDQLKLHIVMIK